MLRILHCSVTFPIKKPGQRGTTRPFNNEIIKIVNSIDKDRWHKDILHKSLSLFNDVLPTIRFNETFIHYPDTLRLYETSWVVYDRNVLELITRIIENAEYAITEITNPWVPNDEFANLWINCKYEDFYVEIEFLNAISLDKDVKNLEDMFLDKNKVLSVQLHKKLEGEIYFKQGNSFNDYKLLSIYLKLTILRN